MSALLTLPSPTLPGPPQFQGRDAKALSDYLGRLTDALRASLEAAYNDLANGYFKLTILAAAPALGDLEEGQAVLVDTGAARTLYYRINGVLRTATLT